jgi:hypothetical protein
MYWEHGYTDEDIAQRLRLSEQLVRAITSKDYTETLVWDEDAHTYRTIRTARTRKPKQTLSIPARTPVTTSKEDQIRQQLDRIAQSESSIQTPLQWIMNKG